MEDTEKADSEPIPENDDASASPGKFCALCGCATPAVRCDRCNSQIFCLSCDDMYHRHPKRKLHLRKAVDSIWSSSRSPRLRRRTDLPGDPCKIPIPPPRTKKRERHTMGGRIFLKSGLELGSFGHSKVFDTKNLMPNSKDYFSGQKSPASLVGSNCDDDIPIQSIRNETPQIYENDNMPNADDGSMRDRSPWNTRPNIASPIQVSIPSNSPDIVTNGQEFGYPTKPQSQSVADLTGHSGHAVGHHPYHFHPPYPYMHPPMHPSYSHSMAHLNCPQCISSSWSNLMSPHASPYFHPMPWGSAQNMVSRGHPMPGQAGPMKHSHGDLVSYPDSSFHYPYPGAGYYHNGPPVVDPNFIKDLHDHAELQKMKRRAADSIASPHNEEMDITDAANAETEASTSSNVAPSTAAVTSDVQDVPIVDEEPPLPEIPTEPWSCLHCTYINPPGLHICQVCCKTSYGNKSGPKPPVEESRPRSRDSESPLINRDAFLNSPGISGFKEAQKEEETVESQEMESESRHIHTPSEISEAACKLTTETQTSTTTKSTDVQTQNVHCKSIASSTDSIFQKQEISVQTEVEATAQNCSVATDPMISSQSLESLLSGVSAPPYHNRRAGWGRGTTSFSTQSLYERGRSRSPMPRSASMYNEAHSLGRDSNFASEEAMHSLSQAWLSSDPMYYKPHNQGLGQALSKEDYFDGTWGSMDKLNRRDKHKKDKSKVESKPKFHRSLDDLKGDKRPEVVHTQELMMLQTVKEAERCGFSLEDLHVAYLHCGRENPVYWLEDNWSSMTKNVIALAAKYGEDNEENDVGVITSTEAKEALRIHRGDIWDAVTECIENRQRKILELTVRGNFKQKQISDALKHNEGNVELAYADLLRASTRRHKFILSPGLSEDSEVDLNLYNPIEDSAVDRNVSLSPLKAAKHDISLESKMEKKKSDFLTKLSSIRQAQSERRKAREEKELIRESGTADLPDADEVILKEKEDITEDVPSVIRQDSEKLDETVVAEEDVPVSAVDTENKQEEAPNVEDNVTDVKEVADDSVPVDFDTNWEDSQGQWIEEYDEQWDEEADSQWSGLGKKFQKMEKEFEEEARQMAALWEKEELEDEVFEEETKDVQSEVAPDTQKKFDDWVKANLSKVDSSEFEEEETKEKVLEEDITDVSVKDSHEASGPSPLQHYPTEYDLSKSQLESDWVDLPADEEIEKLAHDIVSEGSDIENKFDEDMISYDEEKKLRKSSDQYSDEDWEKIELDEQLQEVNELDQFSFPDKDEGEVDVDISLKGDVDERDYESSFGITSDVTSQITIDRDSNVTYKNIDLSAENADVAEPTIIDSLPEVKSPREKLSSSDGDQPKPPVRRKSKLNSAAIEQALKNQAMVENQFLPTDIPPALPEKVKNKESEPQVPDIYAVPDKASKLNQQEFDEISNEPEKVDSSVPQKPPRLPLSPHSSLQRSEAVDAEIEVSVKAVPSKEASPVTSLSNESDSNCFADSESDTEIKRHTHKNIHRKPVKYENEFDELEGESFPKTNLEKRTLEGKDDFKLDSDIELEDDIDLEPLEPLPAMKDIDYDPELPILLSGRGGRMRSLDDVRSPKAFREDTARPLQLFKATKREAPTSSLDLTSPVLTQADNRNLVDETAFNRKPDAESLLCPIAGSFPETDAEQSALYENQSPDRYYYNETVSSQNLIQNQLPDQNQTYENETVSPQNLIQNQMPDQNQTYENEIVSPQNLIQKQLSNEVLNYEELQTHQELLPEQETVQQTAQSPTPTVEDEMSFAEMESMSAADYFFGRYNEVTVTRPKKKTPVKAKTPAATTTKPAPPTGTMSTSATTFDPKSGVSLQMEQSASAILETESQPGTMSSVQSALPNQQLQYTASTTTIAKETLPSAGNKTKEPAVDEYLPFADDYLFGCYNQVVIPKKPKNKPVSLAPIPKLGGASLSRTSSFQKDEKPVIPRPASPEVAPKEPEEEMPNDNESISSESLVSADISVYDDVFHDLPSEMLSNQSFDDGGSIYYESFQDAVEDLSGTTLIDSNVVNVRAKTVHFEEPKAPLVPPRKSKGQSVQKAGTTTSTTTADEYLYRQYEVRSLPKKKTSSM